MKKVSYRFQKGDFIAVGVVIAGIVLSFFLVHFCFHPASKAEFAAVYKNGTLVRKVPLSVNQTFEIHGDYTNIVTVQDGKIAVTESNCPSNDCVHQGWRDAGAIICLPNSVEIRIESDSDVDFVVH